MGRVTDNDDEGPCSCIYSDLKYLGKKYSHAKDYPETHEEALEEMVRQNAELISGERKGVIVRHLLLPVLDGIPKRTQYFIWGFTGQ